MYKCKECHEIYTNTQYEWCKFCQIKNLEEISTSGNEIIDNFIQERRLEINNSSDIVFEWIPYDQFFNINEVDNDDSSTICSAKWKIGPLNWDHYHEKKYIRNTRGKEVVLKYSHNLQNINGFLNEVYNFTMSFDNYFIQYYNTNILNRLKNIQSTSKYMEYHKIRIQMITF